MRRFVPAIAVALAITPFLACGDEEILLATLPPTTDAASPTAPRRCVTDLECGAQAFCARMQCGDVGGTCAPLPIVCEEQPSPVCGCDGITYWNDCLRRAAAITSKTAGECTFDVAERCGGAAPPGTPAPPCPAGSFCARFLPPGPSRDCPADVPGTCWALPAVCPTESGPDRWIDCRGPDVACRTTCDAIHRGAIYRRAKSCF